MRFHERKSNLARVYEIQIKLFLGNKSKQLSTLIEDKGCDLCKNLTYFVKKFRF